MRTQADWRTEIDRLLSVKVAEAVAQVESQREKSFLELSELSTQLESLQHEKENLNKERATLNPLKDADMKALGLMDMRMTKISKQERSLQKRTSAIVAELTELPGDSPLLWLIERKEHGRV